MDATQLIAVTKYPYGNLSEELRIGDWLYTSLSLPFIMEQQTQSQWCWAATATSVSHFYWFSNWTQCLVANAELGHNDCCNDPVSGACNVPWYLDKALTRTENFVSVTGPVSFDTVYNELLAGRVVGARIGWSGGGGHFVAIYGCATFFGRDQYFDIDDPIYGKSTPTVDTFSTNYQGSGTWTNTYFTKRQPIVIRIKPILLEEEIVRLIWETRSLLQLKYGNLREVKSPRDLSVAIPHYVYTLGLDALIQAQKLPEQPTLLRVLEVQGEKSQAFFDIDTKGPSPRLLQMSGATPYLDLFNRGLALATKWATQSDAEVELRLLQVPALHIDALWLHYDDSEKDVFIPIRVQGPLTAFKAYSGNDFLTELTAIAKAQPQIDNLMGS